MVNWFAIRPDCRKALKDPVLRSYYKHYFSVLEGKGLPYHMIARMVQVELRGDLDALWEEHGRALGEFWDLVGRNPREFKPVEPNLLQLKAEIAERILRGCRFCEWRCGTDRTREPGRVCRAGKDIAVSTAFIHLGEEPEISPSYTVFTLGCNLACIHCQNWEISTWAEKGSITSPSALARSIDRAWRMGARNANLVGGEPTIWLHAWLRTFTMVREPIPVFWNSNGIYSEEAMRLLEGFADIIKIDFKYGNDRCAMRISRAPRNYMEIMERNLKHARRVSEPLIRVLVLPGHLECCLRNILKRIVDWTGRDTRVNVMFQYYPAHRAPEGPYPELKRRLSWEEMEEARKMVLESGLQNVLIG